MARPARTYRKVEPDVWMSDDFRALSAPKPNAQTLWLHLLTSPRTISIPGVIVATPGVMADDLRWSRRGFDKAMAEIVAAGLAEIDPSAGLVVLTKALIVDGKVRDSAHPGSVNAVRSWVTSLLKLKSCRLRSMVAARLSLVMESIGGEFPKAFAESMAESCTTDLGSHAASISPAIGTQGSGIREQSLSLARGEGATPEQPGEIGRLVDSAVDGMNAARKKLDPASRPIGPFDDQPGREQLRSRLRSTSADRREPDLKLALSVLVQEATTAGDVSKLRLGMLGGPAAWPRLLAGSAKAPTPAPRAGPRFANDRQPVSMPAVGKGPAPVVVSPADRAETADELRRSREALGIVTGLASTIGVRS